MLSGRVVSTPSLALAFVLLGSGSGAQVPAEQGSCAGSHGSLARVGCRLAQELLPSAAGAEVTVVELKSDRELPRPAALRERLRDVAVAALAAPRGSNERSKLRLELRLEASHGVLRVSAELRRAVGLWQRARSQRTDVERRAFVEVPLDAELRALVPPPPLVVSQVLKLKAPERGIVALACGALDPDGGQELALVSRSSVRVGRIVKGVFAERSKASWSKLSVIAPAPLREPIASADITRAGRLRVGITDRRDGVELDAALSVTARFEGRLPVPGGGCVSRSGVGLSGLLGECRPGDGAPARQLGSVLDALAGSSAAQLGRELTTGAIERAGQPLSLSAPPGAQLALGDADADGRPELAYSSNSSDGTSDRLTIVSLDGARAQLRFELAAPHIGAIGICARPEGSGMAPIALASGSELWLIQ
ncbi:MAG TPA: hypothetical protein VIW29_05820 [Polyangiaceae bacterium]